MCTEGEAKRPKKQESLYTENSSFIILITKCFYHLPTSAELFRQVSYVGALDLEGLRQVQGQVQGRFKTWFITDILAHLPIIINYSYWIVIILLE